MGKLRHVTGKEMVHFLERQGFIVLRIRGAHQVMESGSHHTVVPVHGSSPIKTGTLRKILRDVDLPPTEFERFWTE